MSDFLPIVILIATIATLVTVLLTSRRRTDDRQGELLAQLASLEKLIETLDRAQHDENARIRDEIVTSSRLAREELSGSLAQFGDSLLKRMVELAGMQKAQLDIFSEQLKTLTEQNVRKLDRINETVEIQLKTIQEDNNKKLEQMRATVDEKLHDTLEKRLGESFKLVSDRLELVHKGLGEMQNLAIGVGDLKKVLTNVKTRGTFGEIQLGALLEQILSPEQYEMNCETKKGSNTRVEFAIKLPGKNDETTAHVFLPIDAKFPQEDYLRLIEAQEQGDVSLVADFTKQLDRSIREMAKNIRDKYLDPPNTTDFGVMFLPTEGLYAEVLRIPELFEALQQEYKVVITGPTTIAAFLNSLQMGFRTLAIEKRSSEVWSLLGAVKTEFSSFGIILDRTRKKLQEASNSIDSAATRSRAIERKLRTVQEIPTDESGRILADLPSLDDDLTSAE